MSKHYLDEAESTKCYVKNKWLLLTGNFSDKEIIHVGFEISTQHHWGSPLFNQFKLFHTFILDIHISKNHCDIFFCQWRLVFLVPWGFTCNIMNHTHITCFALIRTLWKTRKTNLYWSSVYLYPESKKCNQDVKNITFILIKAINGLWFLCARNLQ